MRIALLLLTAALSIVAEEAPPGPEGAVVRAILKSPSKGQFTLKIVQVDRSNDPVGFRKFVGEDEGAALLSVPVSSLRWNKPDQLVADALVKVRFPNGVDAGGDVLEVKAPGAWSADDAKVVPERLARVRTKVTEELKDPHLFLTTLQSVEVGDFGAKWKYLAVGGPFPIDPANLDRSVKMAVGVGTELELELGPEDKPVKATVVAGGIKEAKMKGLFLGIGGVLSIFGLIWAWIVLRKKLLES